MDQRQIVETILNAADENPAAYEIAGIDRHNGWRWRNKIGTPRLPLLIALAEAVGYEITLKRKSTSARIINRNGRIEAFKDNKLIGYVEADTLFAVGADGYAVEVGQISHRVEIIGKLDAHAKKADAPDM